MANYNPELETRPAYTAHHLTAPPCLTQDEFDELQQHVFEFHTYQLSPNQCSSLLAQRIQAPEEVVWSIVRRFDKPQTYKHFIRSCSVSDDFTMAVGSTRDVNVISGLPAATSTERLDMLDDDRRVTGFSIIGGEHRLRNYRSVTTVHGFHRDGGIWTVVLESYVVDVPEGNTEEDTRLFADTVVKLNLQKLASVAEGSAGDGEGRSQSQVIWKTQRQKPSFKSQKKKNVILLSFLLCSVSIILFLFSFFWLFVNYRKYPTLCDLHATWFQMGIVGNSSKNEMAFDDCVQKYLISRYCVIFHFVQQTHKKKKGKEEKFWLWI